MDINKLYNGVTFKNYKEMCSILNMTPTTSNGKIAQFKELERFCVFHKEGHKIIIDEIYDAPLEKIDNRGKSENSRGNNNIYGESIQLLILDLLAQCKEGKLSISRGKLLLTINMINENYRTCGELTKNLSAYSNIDEPIIFDFYNTCNSNFKSAVETALNNLTDKRILWYETIIKISEKDTYLNREATETEKDYIRDTEKLILNELGYKKVSDVRTSKDWRTFKRMVKNIINEESNIEYYYSAYNISANEKYLQDERKELNKFILESEQKQENKDTLNNTVYDHVIENAEKRHKKGFSANKKISKYRQSSDYVCDIRKLADLLINNDQDDITMEVKKVKLDIDVELEFDDLFA